MKWIFTAELFYIFQSSKGWVICFPNGIFEFYIFQILTFFQRCNWQRFFSPVCRLLHSNDGNLCCTEAFSFVLSHSLLLILWHLSPVQKVLSCFCLAKDILTIFLCQIQGICSYVDVFETFGDEFCSGCEVLM